MLKVGAKAPEFELPDADLTIASLVEYRGRPLVLFFYVRDNTPGCITETVEFSDLEPEFAKLNCSVVGVSRDDCITHGAFRDKHGISVRLLADKDGNVCRTYGVLVRKEVDGVEKDSIDRSTYVIDAQGQIRHIEHGVHPKGHAQTILNFVRELK